MYTKRHPYKVNEHDFTLYIVLAANVRLLCRKSVKHFRQPEFKRFTDVSRTSYTKEFSGT